MHMRCRSFFLLLTVFALSYLTVAPVTFAEPSDQPELEPWVGQYTFAEILQEAYVWDHNITIYKDDTEYYAEISVDGRQTQIRLLSKVVDDSTAIRFLFDKHLPGNQFDRFTPGDFLLGFAMRGSTLLTEWGKLTPNIPQYENTGVYFEKNTPAGVLQTR